MIGLIRSRRYLCLPLWLLAANSMVAFARAGSEPEEFWYANACGPYSAYVALQAMGINIPFDKVARDCDWNDGHTVAVERVEAALRKHPQLIVNTVKTNLAALKSHLDRGGVAIVLVARNGEELDHSFCITRRTGDTFHFVDAPTADGEIQADALTARWQGQTILVSPSASYRLRSEWPFFLLPAFTVVFLAAVTCRNHLRGIPRAIDKEE